jgi:hypothetical protein
MAELTPELRPDYTGKLVTRHVKAPGASNASAGRVPRVNNTQAELGKLRQSITRSLGISMQNFNPSLRLPKRLEAVAELTAKHDMSGCAIELLDGLAAIKKDDDFDSCIGLLERNFETAHAILSTSATYEISYAPTMVTGINMFDFEMTPDQEKTVIEATCRIWIGDSMGQDVEAIKTLFPKRIGGKSGNSIGRTAMREDLAQYIAENQHKADVVVQIVNERGISDPRDIEEMTDSVISPLLDGAL